MMNYYKVYLLGKDSFFICSSDILQATQTCTASECALGAEKGGAKSQNHIIGGAHLLLQVEPS